MAPRPDPLPHLLPDLLVVGHVTLDLVKGDRVPGGTAFYASLAATRLGLRVALLTRGAPPQARPYLSELARVVDIPSPVTTTFENLYTPKGRVQIVQQVAPPIEPSHLPQEWKECPTVLLAPVSREMDPSLASLFPHSFLALSPQGWLRRWDSSGRVRPAPWQGPGESPRAKVAVLSETDLPKEGLPPNWLQACETVILTQGPQGALLHHEGKRLRVPSYPAKEADPTGAGDVFAAAYLVRYAETKDPLASALFAACAASLKVEAPGGDGVPHRPQVEKRMERFPGLRVEPEAAPIPKGQGRI